MRQTVTGKSSLKSGASVVDLDPPNGLADVTSVSSWIDNRDDLRDVCLCEGQAGLVSLERHLR